MTCCATDLLRDGATLCARVEDALAVLDPLRDHHAFETLNEDNVEAEEPLWGEQPLLGVNSKNRVSAATTSARRRRWR
jgi:hypothetical protein